ncbi:hypothetical protein LTR53_009084 [Teratosphaeriaceae sp. CCFEE 6253]|nr:hypothetical protein LTR53_009084 [Teratosphaeriaceae sp. CCFEE 6253]
MLFEGLPNEDVRPPHSLALKRQNTRAVLTGREGVCDAASFRSATSRAADRGRPSRISSQFRQRLLAAGPYAWHPQPPGTSAAVSASQGSRTRILHLSPADHRRLDPAHDHERHGGGHTIRPGFRDNPSGMSFRSWLVSHKGRPVFLGRITTPWSRPQPVHHHQPPPPLSLRACIHPATHRLLFFFPSPDPALWPEWEEILSLHASTGESHRQCNIREEIMWTLFAGIARQDGNREAAIEAEMLAEEIKGERLRCKHREWEGEREAEREAGREMERERGRELAEQEGRVAKKRAAAKRVAEKRAAKKQREIAERERERASADRDVEAAERERAEAWEEVQRELAEAKSREALGAPWLGKEEEKRARGSGGASGSPVAATLAGSAIAAAQSKLRLAQRRKERDRSTTLAMGSGTASLAEQGLPALNQNPTDKKLPPPLPTASVYAPLDPHPPSPPLERATCELDSATTFRRAVVEDGTEEGEALITWIEQEQLRRAAQVGDARHQCRVSRSAQRRSTAARAGQTRLSANGEAAHVADLMPMLLPSGQVERGSQTASLCVGDSDDPEEQHGELAEPIEPGSQATRVEQDRVAQKMKRARHKQNKRDAQEQAAAVQHAFSQTLRPSGGAQRSFHVWLNKASAPSQCLVCTSWGTSSTCCVKLVECSSEDSRSQCRGSGGYIGIGEQVLGVKSNLLGDSPTSDWPLETSCAGRSEEASDCLLVKPCSERIFPTPAIEIWLRRGMEETVMRMEVAESSQQQQQQDSIASRTERSSFAAQSSAERGHGSTDSRSTTPITRPRSASLPVQRRCETCGTCWPVSCVCYAEEEAVASEVSEEVAGAEEIGQRTLQPANWDEAISPRSFPAREEAARQASRDLYDQQLRLRDQIDEQQRVLQAAHVIHMADLAMQRAQGAYIAFITTPPPRAYEGILWTTDRLSGRIGLMQGRPLSDTEAPVDLTGFSMATIHTLSIRGIGGFAMPPSFPAWSRRLAHMAGPRERLEDFLIWFAGLTVHNLAPGAGTHTERQAIHPLPCLVPHPPGDVHEERPGESQEPIVDGEAGPRGERDSGPGGEDSTG